MCKGQKGGNTVTAWWHARRAYFDAAGYVLEIRREMVVFKGKRIWKCLFQTGDFFSFFRYFCLALLRGRGKNFFVLTLGGIKRWKLFSFGKNLGMLVFKTSSLLSRIKTFENF